MTGYSSRSFFDVRVERNGFYCGWAAKNGVVCGVFVGLCPAKWVLVGVVLSSVRQIARVVFF